MMKIRLTKTNPGCAPEELSKLAEAIGHELPADFGQFLSQHDGARPETNEFKVGQDNGAGVNVFFRTADVAKEKASLGDRLSADTWPIADAEGGNLVCLKLVDGVWSVVFWDHEREDETHLADSFTAFLESLERFDPQSVELKPGQVKSAWIDPSLLE
jgi:hypothetical protein